MSEGSPWIDRVMVPLMGGQLATSDYNRIYEAVSRGDERQGHALVAAIVNACKPKPLTTEAMREIAQATFPLDQVSVRHLREVARALGHAVEEAV